MGFRTCAKLKIKIKMTDLSLLPPLLLLLLHLTLVILMLHLLTLLSKTRRVMRRVMRRVRWRVRVRREKMVVQDLILLPRRVLAILQGMNYMRGFVMETVSNMVKEPAGAGIPFYLQPFA